jgi:hypothetical protein
MRAAIRDVDHQTQRCYFPSAARAFSAVDAHALFLALSLWKRAGEKTILSAAFVLMDFLSDALPTQMHQFNQRAICWLVF